MDRSGKIKRRKAQGPDWFFHHFRAFKCNHLPNKMYFENVSRRNVVPIICERVGRGKYSNSHFLFMDCGKREKVCCRNFLLYLTENATTSVSPRGLINSSSSETSIDGFCVSKIVRYSRLGSKINVWAFNSWLLPRFLSFSYTGNGCS